MAERWKESGGPATASAVRASLDSKIDKIGRIDEHGVPGVFGNHMEAIILGLGALSVAIIALWTTSATAQSYQAAYRLVDQCGRAA